MLLQLDRHGFGTAKFQPGYLIQATVYIIQPAQSLQQAKGGFLANPGDTGNIVRLVPQQGEVVDNQLRWYAKLFNHPCPVQGRVIHGVNQGDMLIDQLSYILVTGGDNHRLLCRCRLLCQGADHIVSFNPVNN